MPYASTTGGTYHDRRRCRRLHATGGRIRAVDAGDREPCPHCVDTDSRNGRDEAGDPASVSFLIDDGRCPWCDDYEGAHVGQHASSAHPDEWAAYRDG